MGAILTIGSVSLVTALLIAGHFSFISLEERMETQMFEEYEYMRTKDLDEISAIKMGYLAIFLTEIDLERSREMLDRIVEMQRETGEIGSTVNGKLTTGLCVFSLIVGHEKIGEEAYREAALKGGAFLVGEIEKWKTINEIKITEISQDARHSGRPRSSLECYYWTSPNDLGIMALGLGALVPYDSRYAVYAEELGDALYNMQLANGGWYDGYTRIPIRRDQSSWYVVMAMLGLWQCYRTTGNERYRESLVEARGWMEQMWDDGSVYDIFADEENLTAALSEGRVIGIPDDLRCDYERYEETNERDYVARSDHTAYYGEHSFLLAHALLIYLGIEIDRYPLKKTVAHILETKDEDPSNWFLLSLWLVLTRDKYSPV